MTDLELIEIEKIYFDIMFNMLYINIGKIITLINNQKNYLVLTLGVRSNSIEHAIENIVEGIIAKSLDWNIASIPVASDSCYECGDAIIHIDAKTIKKSDNDFTHNKINIRKTQTSYNESNTYCITRRDWKPMLRHYENHIYFGKIPNLTYAIKVIYSETNLVEEISLNSIPNGQLASVFRNEEILAPGKMKGRGGRTDIRFLFEKILIVPNQSWRKKMLFKRQS